MDVCAQCHANLKPRGAPFSYRPGQPLEKSFRVARTRHVEDDIDGNQAQYLRASKCFQKSDLTCITCHDPHRPSDAAGVRGACLSCHAPAACPEQPRVGDVVHVVPNHCCVVSNMVDEVYGVRSGRVQVAWPVAARGRLR